jgi:hypothetical protein
MPARQAWLRLGPRAEQACRHNVCTLYSVQAGLQGLEIQKTVHSFAAGDRLALVKTSLYHEHAPQFKSVSTLTDWTDTISSFLQWRNPSQMHR